MARGFAVVLVCCCLSVVAAAETVAVGLVFDEHMAKHDNGPGHPESAKRLTWIQDGLKSRQLLEKLVKIPAKAATDEQILTVHTATHLRRFMDDKLSMAVPATTRLAARLSAGGAIAACDAVMKGTVKRAFCVIRPPGHHAGPETAEGFCYFNNVAIAARHLQRVHDLKRVLILDWDVHAGNGTYAIFKKDPSVFDFHVHQDPKTIYPGTGYAHEKGEGAGEGFSANHPLPRKSNGAAVQAVLQTQLRAACERFRPQCILISAGFDMHADDPLGSFTVTTEDFASMTQTLVALAEQYCQGRLISVLEGGYSKAAMHDAVPAHIEALMQTAAVAAP